MRRSPRLNLVGLVSLSLIALLSFDVDYVAADPQEYHERMKAIMVGGELPYLEAPFEHLPTMLVPMMVAWFLGGSASPFSFRVIWSVMSVGVVLVCWSQMTYLASRANAKNAIGRAVVMSLPLMPLILFRNDAWAVLLCLVALRLAWEGRMASGVVGTAAILAKGWPVVIIPTLWRAGSRRLAVVVLAVSGAVLATVSSLPGFISARQFDGLHTETLGGSIFGLSEALSGKRPFLLLHAGAIYIDAPALMALPGIAIGLLFGVCALWLMASRNPTRTETMQAIGVGVIAILLASPLQSSQFVFWAVPFVAFSSRRLTLVGQTLIGVLATWTVARLPLLREGFWGWYAVVLLRNILMVVVGAALIAELIGLRTSSRAGGPVGDEVS